MGPEPHRHPRRPGEPSATLGPMAFALVLSASFVVVLDFSIVNVALASIQRQVGFSAATLQWVVTAYAISFGGFLVLGGKLADRFGHRRMFVLGLLTFTVSSLAGGLASGPELLVSARVVQGIGAALVAPAALAVITTGYPQGPARNRALGIYGATASVGFVGGLVLGGALVQFLGWRAVFFVNVPVGLSAALLSLRYLPGRGSGGPDRSLDIGGGLLLTSSLATLVYAASQAPVVGLASPQVLLALALLLITLAGFVVLERHHPQPLIRFGMLRLRTLRAANAVTVLMGIWSGGEMVVMTLYLQLGLHYSPLLTGLAMAPQGVVGLLTGLAGARLMARLGLQRLLMGTAASAALGFLILSQSRVPGDYPAILVAVSLIGFGTAGTVFASTVGASSGVSNAEQGVAGGLVNTSRQLGAAVGAAVLLAMAEGGARAAGTTTSIPGDRTAMLAAAIAALAAIAIAWWGIGKQGPSPAVARPARRPIRLARSAPGWPSSPSLARRGPTAGSVPGTVGAKRPEGLREEQLAQQPRELPALFDGKTAEKPVLILQVRQECLVDNLVTAGGEGDQGAPAIVRVRQPAHQPSGLDAVDAVGHGPR